MSKTKKLKCKYCRKEVEVGNNAVKVTCSSCTQKLLEGLELIEQN